MLVCNDGTYSPSCTCARTQTQQYFAPKDPLEDATANANLTLNTDGKTYKVDFDWSESSGVSGYSIAISKVKGADPGPRTDTVLSQYTFNNVAPGNYYVNIKALYSGRWSQIWAWEVKVPAWESPSVSNFVDFATPNPTSDTQTSVNVQPLDASSGAEELMLVVGIIIMATLALAKWGIQTVFVRILQAIMMVFSFVGITLMLGGMTWGVTGFAMNLAYAGFDSTKLSFMPFYLGAVVVVCVYLLYYWRDSRRPITPSKKVIQ